MSLGMYKEQGFSVLELALVVAIVLVLCAIAIPRLLQSRDTAEHAAAVSSMHTIVSAQTSYALAYPQQGYADALSKLGPPKSSEAPTWEHAALLDEVLGCPKQPCMKAGFLFEIGNAQGNPINSYHVGVKPVGSVALAAELCVDESGVVKQADACKQDVTAVPNATGTR
jgi:type II secretory pathway pseudopilin PulG